ncbi:MAG: glycosyltransferase family 4 protein [Ruminococcaceae bacterium]|nr:glycosyltransferase family 4 protein [Oscillospiraceae bacterium]
MLILSNSLTQSADEGSLKLASSLVKRIKNKYPENTYIVSFEREFPQGDEHLSLNKLHISRRLISLIKKQKVLYIPFPAPTTSMAVRIFLLSLFARRGLRVMMIRQYPMNRAAQALLRFSGAELVVFSKKACDYYSPIVNGRVQYLKTGVDTEKFKPVSAQKARELKIKYGFDPESPIVLHVGHMKEGRNVAELTKIDKKYQVLLVVSTLSKERQNPELRERLLKHPNIRIMEGYIPCIEEIYQMCDVYFFPVKQMGHCIDVPLSCLEAAACNKPIITTDYGEMAEFAGINGISFIDEINENTINENIEKLLQQKDLNIRDSVLNYDFDKAIEYLFNGN